VPRLNQGSQLLAERLEDIRTPARRAERDFPTTTSRKDERAARVVIGIAISVRANELRLSAIQTGFAGLGVVVGPGAAVRCGVSFGTGGEAGVESGPDNVLDWVWEHTIAGPGGWR
jgi:hypothetical protein